MKETTKCTYNPEPLKGVPLGMHHCPECGCMVIAALPHGECDPDDCWLHNE